MVMRHRPVWMALSLALLLIACDRRDGAEDQAAGDSDPLPPEVTLPSAADAAAVSGDMPIAMPATVDAFLTDAQNKAASIDAGRPGLAVQSRQQVVGEVKTDVSVYFSDAQVVLVEEKIQTIDNSQATNRYYFDSGSLFLYEDEGRWLDVNPPSPLVSKNFKRAMVFNPTGKLVTAAKSIDGVQSALGEYEAIAVLIRVNDLLEQSGQPALAPPSEVAAAALPADAATAEAAPAPATETPAQPVASADAAGEGGQPGASDAPSVAAAGEASTSGKPSYPAGDRISFSSGASSTRVNGTAPASGTRDYVVHGKAGQLLTLSLEGAPNAVFAVYSQRGEIVADLTNWSSKLPREEDYTIKVGQGSRGAGPADFSLNVKLE